MLKNLVSVHSTHTPAPPPWNPTPTLPPVYLSTETIGVLVEKRKILIPGVLEAQMEDACK